MARAKTLLTLYQQRDMFRQMGSTGLSRAQERVDAVAAKYAKKSGPYDEKLSERRHSTFNTYY